MPGRKTRGASRSAISEDGGGVVFRVFLKQSVKERSDIGFNGGTTLERWRFWGREVTKRFDGRSK